MYRRIGKKMRKSYQETCNELLIIPVLHEPSRPLAANNVT